MVSINCSDMGLVVITLSLTFEVVRLVVSSRLLDGFVLRGLLFCFGLAF